ncbi:MAG: acetolactate synthase large subunit, partial [Rhodobacteraceae bacterium]|nr:acetolactate synthase large subunit [Paracoccaceae bacterium]
ANTAWDEAKGPAQSLPPTRLHRPSTDDITTAAERLHGPGAVLLVGGEALFGPLRQVAGQIAQATGCRLMADTLVSRVARGAGTARMEQLVYPVEPKIAQLKEAQSITLVGTERPVAFFAYPGKPSTPEAATCAITSLCSPTMDIGWTLRALADELGLTEASPFEPTPLVLPDVPTGELTLEKVGHALAALLPENAIVHNEAVTSGHQILPSLQTARPFDILGGTGGAIGLCLPCATGAALACPDRKVIALTGDGSAMYTEQSLWTLAREGLDVTVIVFANRGYQILRNELQNVGVNQYGQNAQAMFDMENPTLDWVALAQGHGVPGRRADDMESFVSALQAGVQGDGPSLIEVVCG